MTIPKSDMLRDSKNVMEPDPRQKYFEIKDRQTNKSREFQLEDYLNPVKNLHLNNSVPDDIKVHFETTKNLFLYSWFAYRFLSVAQLHALASLEFALKEKLQIENISKGNISLGKLLKEASKRDWFNRKEVNIEVIELALPQLRNEIAHGSSTLLGKDEVMLIIKECAKLINNLFR